MFVIAAACKDTMQDHGCRVCCREGVSRGFNSEAMPAPMLLSNSLYPDVTSDDCHEPDDSVDLGQDNDNGEETAGVSSFFVGLSQEENIFPVLMSWLLGPTVVWWSCVFLGKHWVSETVKTNTWSTECEISPLATLSPSSPPTHISRHPAPRPPFLSPRTKLSYSHLTVVPTGACGTCAEQERVSTWCFCGGGKNAIFLHFLFRLSLQNWSCWTKRKNPIMLVGNVRRGFLWAEWWLGELFNCFYTRLVLGFWRASRRDDVTNSVDLTKILGRPNVLGRATGCERPWQGGGDT